MITTPLILTALISDSLPADFMMPTGKIVNKIAFTLLLPLALGMFYLYLYPQAAVAVSKWCIRASLLGIVLIVVGSMSAGRLNLAAFGMDNVLLVVLFTLALTVTGWLAPRLFRLSRPVTLPPDTIINRDSSPRVNFSGWRSNCARHGH